MDLNMSGSGILDKTGSLKGEKLKKEGGEGQ